MSDAQLLRDYAEHRTEAAFSEIVARHTDLVYSAALRQVSAPDLAGDVAQEVFSALASKASPLANQLAGGGSLVGWLYRSTRFAALNHLRDDRRRRVHEKQAMEQLATNAETAPDWDRLCPVLDEAMADLNDEDREALLLRFFKQHDLHAVGAALGVSDDTAQKRVSRALDKLRQQLARRGITSPAAALSAVIMANAVQAAPAGLAATISSAAVLTGTALTSTVAATKAIAMTTLQKTLITGTITLVVGAGIYEARQVSSLRGQVQTLKHQQAPMAEQIQQLQRERDDATNRAAVALGEIDRMQREYAQVLKLRGDLTRVSAELRQLKAANSNTTNELSVEVEGWVKRGNSFKQWFKDHPEKSIPELQLLWTEDWIWTARANPTVVTNRTEGNTIEMIASHLREKAKSRLAGILGHGLSLYVAANAGELPGSLTQLLAYLPQQGDKPITENAFPSAQPVNDSMLARYELRFTGPISNVPREQPIVVEKAPADPGVDTLLKIKADGFCYDSVGIIDMMAGTLQPWSGEDVERIKPFLK